VLRVSRESSRSSDGRDHGALGLRALTTPLGAAYNRANLVEDRRTPDPAADRQRELDARVEELTRQIADVVKSAGDDERQDLRDYAIGLLKEETEFAEAPPAPTARRNASASNPLGIALLLGLVSLPLLLVFLPVGLTMLAMALVLGAWGLVLGLIRR